MRLFLDRRAILSQKLDAWHEAQSGLKGGTGLGRAYSANESNLAVQRYGKLIVIAPASYQGQCVICGCTTEVPPDRPISEHPTYLRGAGELCRKCCVELYRVDDLRLL